MIVWTDERTRMGVKRVRKREEVKAALNLDAPDCFKDELYVWLTVSFGPRLPHHEEKSKSFKVKGRLNQITLGLI